jgi:glycine hydroxymethyltransferase
VSGGTDSGIVLRDAKSSTVLTGSKVERVFELASITTNSNSVPGDKAAVNPLEVFDYLGSPALL